MFFVKILEKEYDKFDTQVVQCLFLIYPRTQLGYKFLNPVSRKYVICAVVTLFFKNTPYFSASLCSFTTPSTTLVTLLTSLEDSPPLQVYQ